MQQWYPALPNTKFWLLFHKSKPNTSANKNITWKSLIFTHKHNKPLFLSAIVFSAYFLWPFLHGEIVHSHTVIVRKYSCPKP